MAITNSANRPARRSAQRALGPHTIFAAAIAVAFAGSAAATTLLPHDLVLPAVCTLFFVLAATAALFGSKQAPTSGPRGLTYWDIAGALTFVGIFAAALIDPEQLVRLVEGDRRGQ